MFLILLTSCQGDSLFVKNESELYEGDESGECSDNADNDQDGLFDCEDEGCIGSDDCLDEDTDVPDTGENNTETDTGEEDTGTPDPLDIDNDGDGFSENQGDCDDTNADLTPVDSDNDGFSICDEDCDDSNASVYPEAAEIAGDGIDQDCNGADLEPSATDYTTPGEHSLTIPSGVSLITVSMWGGGGAGGNQLNSTGGGSAFVAFSKTVTPGETYTIMVGEGGSDQGDGGGASLLFENFGASNEKLWAVSGGGGGGASDGNSGNSWSGGRGGAGGFMQGQSGSALGVHQNGSVYAYCESASGGTGASQSLSGIGGTYVGTENGCNGGDGNYLQGGSVTSSGLFDAFVCNINTSYSPWQSPQSQGNGGGGAGGSGMYGGGSGGFVHTYCGGGGGGGSSYAHLAVSNLTYEAGQEQNQGNVANAQGAGKGGERAYGGILENGNDGRVLVEW